MSDLIDNVYEVTLGPLVDSLGKFFKWLFSVEDEKEISNLSPELKKFREDNISKYNSGNNKEKDEIARNFINNKKLQEEILNHREQLEKLGLEVGLTKDVMHAVDRYITQFDNKYQTRISFFGKRGFNPLGKASTAKEVLQKKIEKYSDKQNKIKNLAKDSETKVIEIQKCLKLVDYYRNSIQSIENDVRLTDKEKEILKKSAEDEIKNTLKEAAKYRSVDRPLSLSRDIERELRNTLSREQRKLGAFVGKDVEVELISIDERTGKPNYNVKESNQDEHFNKLDSAIKVIEDLKRANKQIKKISSKNLNEIEIDKNTKEFLLTMPIELKQKLLDKKLIEVSNDGGITIHGKNTEKVADELINHLKDYRSLDHRAGLTPDLIFAELKMTNNRNKTRGDKLEQLSKKTRTKLTPLVNDLKKVAESQQIMENKLSEIRQRFNMQQKNLLQQQQNAMNAFSKIQLGSGIDNKQIKNKSPNQNTQDNSFGI